MKRTHSLPPKITRPSVSRIFLRKRLLRLFDGALKSKAVWVCGPPGAGKTTFVNGFIDKAAMPCVWYQVDESDGDIATLFYYLSLSLKSVAKAKKGVLPRFAPEYLGALGAFTRGYFKEFFTRLPKPCAVVFDNFQDAPGGSRLCEVVKDALAVAPEKTVFIIVSRTEPPSVFSRSIVNREIQVIGWEGLRLTGSESEGIAKHWGYKLPAGEAISRLHEISQGWIAGLLLMLERAKAGGGSRQDIKKSALQSVFNYFMEEIFDKTDPETRDFLEKTSFLPNMTPSMAAIISGSNRAETILSRLSTHQFFIDKRINEDVVYQYHPLFREFLIERARADCPPVQLSGLQGAAAKLLADEGRVEDAASIYLETADWAGLVILVHRHAPVLLAQGRLQILSRWLEAIPDSVKDEDGWLLYFTGICRLPFNPSLARPAIVAAYEIFKSREDAAGLFLSWSAVVDTFLYEWKDFKPLDKWITEFERLIKKYTAFPTQDIGERAVACFFGALIFRQPHHPKLPYWEQRAKSIIESSQDSTRRMLVGYNLTLYYNWTGRFSMASALVTALSPMVNAPGAPPLPRLMWLVSEAMCNFCVSSYDSAFKTIEQGLELADSSGIHLMDIIFWGQGVYSALAVGDIPLAESYLEKIAQARTSVHSYGDIFYHHQASLVAMHRGDFPSALENARISLRLTEHSGSPFLMHIQYWTLIYIMIESGGDYREIKRHIEESRRFAQETSSHFYEYGCLIMEAALELGRGDEDAYLERLGKAFEIGKLHGLRYYSLLRPATKARLCAAALSAGLETEYVKELIRLNGLVPEGPLPDVEDWPWPVKIYTFGRFEVLREGKFIVFPRKAQQKPLDMLKAIIALGGTGVGQETVTDALWPSSDGDMAYRSFATTLHRLRKLIGNDRVLQYKDGTLTLDRRYCWVDLWGFEGLAARSDAAAKSGNREKAARLLEGALALYKGPFMRGFSQLPCAITPSERLRDKFIKYVDKLAGYYLDMDRFEASIDAYNAGIEVDDLCEMFYRGLMLCYKRSGNRNEAIKAYKRCKSALSTVLGTEPSEETEKLYRKILA